MKLIGLALAGLLLSFGTLLATLSHICTSLGRRLSSESALHAWSKALRSFHTGPRQRKGQATWEGRLLAAGPPMISSIFGALAVLWTLLLGGSILVWLVVHGYGLPVLIGTVALGAAIGHKRVRLEQHMPRHEQLN